MFEGIENMNDCLFLQTRKCERMKIGENKGKVEKSGNIYKIIKVNWDCMFDRGMRDVICSWTWSEAKWVVYNNRQKESWQADWVTPLMGMFS